MRRWVGLVMATVVGAGVLVGAPARAHEQPVARRQVTHALRATPGDGARIADDLGRTVILRGVNVNSLGEYYQEWPDLPSTVPLTEDDFAQMAALGFNVVRLIMSWSRLEPRRGEIDEAYLDEIAQAVRSARRHDLYVVLDMHQDAWGPAVFTPDGVDCPSPLQRAVGWDGAPAWATALAGTAATCFLALREVSLAVGTSFENFYLDTGGVQSELVKTWAAVAERFSGEAGIAGYDLLNEPNPGLAILANDYTLLGSFYDRTLDALRAAERAGGGFSHIGFFEPSVLTGPLALPGPLPGFTGDRNVVYAPHLYNESISPLPLSMEDGFANAATAAATYGTTFFSGEWGWFGDAATDRPKIARYAALEDEYLVGGTWWQWKQACGDPHAIGVRGHRPSCATEGNPYSDGLVVAPPSWTDILGRAYPRAAPGRLRSIDSNVRSGGLTITGIADRGGVAADLWVPARCSSPAVAGLNTGPAVIRPVTGGWRIAVEVPAAGSYRVTVTCSASR